VNGTAFVTHVDDSDERILETKCTAETPRCSDCVANDVACVYENNKKDRLGEMERQKQVFVDLVLSLRSSVNASDRLKIEAALHEVSNLETLIRPSVDGGLLRRTIPCGR
jgi:hypothetical protein